MKKGLLFALPLLCCGHLHANEVTAKIVGGEVAPADRWPWMSEVAVEDQNNSNQFLLCGGSLISPRWVLTAAHCVTVPDTADPVPLEDIHIFVGDDEFRNDLSNSLDARDLRIHSSYTGSGTTGLNHDLALVRIDSQNVAAWPSFIQPETFNDLEARSEEERDEAVTALGWGQTDPDDQSSIAPELQEVQLDYVPRDPCKEQYWSSILTEFMVCAGELNPTVEDFDGEDTCLGDSGGPLFLGRAPNPPLLGITSFGTQECANRTPGVYTHILREIPEVESLTTEAGLALVDLSIDASRNKRYADPGTSITLSPTLSNDSASNTVNQPTASYRITAQGNVSGTYDWGNCTNLLTQDCTPVMQLAAGKSSAGTLDITEQDMTNQEVTVTLTARSDENDYRRRTNRVAHDLIFSNLPNLMVRNAAMTNASQDSDGTGHATVSVTVRNDSPQYAATNVMVNLTLPASTTLANAESLGCLQGPLRCPLDTISTQTNKTLKLELTTDNTQDATLELSVSNDEGDFPTGDTRASVALSYPAPKPSGGGGGGGGSIGWWSLVGLAWVMRRRR